MYILTYMQIYMNTELENKLRQTSKENNIPMSQILAEALEAYFGPAQDKSPNTPVVPLRLEPKFCKNGHPIPYPKETCLGKSCKYS